MRKILFTIFLLFIITITFGQIAPKKVYNATKIEEKPIIDGELNDAIWLQTAEVANKFIQNQPNLGEKSVYKTEVKIVYDNEAIYIGAMLFDENPDSILTQLTERDEIGNTDWFGVIMDTYEDGINGVGFIVSAAGVQFDTKYSSFGEDENWNAVWESEIKIVDNGWIVEMKIPYSALRFPDKVEQSWNFNIVRTVRRTRETSWWNFYDSSKNGFLNQAGTLKGIKNVKSPIRLFFNPYISGNIKNTTNNGEGSWSRGFNVGMDIKYGINEAYTLDMTLVPDFGQVVSDDVVLNLSPFEVRFDENRQFFTEGTELFQKADLFYSRRIGGQPNGFSDVLKLKDEGFTILENPNDIQLINSTKVSGRGKNGLGIGVLNSVTNSATAVVEDSNGVVKEIQTAPLTNYNVIVFDQNLKNNSFVSLINTNVFRNGDPYEANVTGTAFQLQNKKNTYAFSGTGSLSQKYFNGFNNPDLGFRYNLSFGKTSGNIQFRYNNSIISDTYDNNDFGFLAGNNRINNSLWLGLNRFKPFGPFLRGNFNINMFTEHQYSTQRFASFGINMNGFAMTKNFFAFGFGTFVSPIEAYDIFELRTNNRVLAIPTNTEHWAWISTDYRNPFAIDINVFGERFNQEGRNNLGINLGLLFRVNDKLSFRTSTDYRITNNYIGYVARDSLTSEPIVGIRDRLDIENVISGSYIFNNVMGLTLRTRHNWSRATHDEFYFVDDEGHLMSPLTDLNNDFDFNFNFFSIDLVYSWQFAPGSFLTANWKNNIRTFNSDIEQSYFQNFRNTLQNDQTNLFSVKILYFLDYLTLEQVMNKKQFQ
ncbi:MAG: DUF5916 domain-containing protein [Saprospiraceae bacterium]